MKYNAPIMALAVSPDNSRLVAGMVDGTLEIRQKDSKSLTDLAGHDMDDSAKTKQILRGGTYKYFLRGKNSVPSADDYKVMVQRKTRLKAYDRAFRKFQVHTSTKIAFFVVSCRVVVVSWSWSWSCRVASRRVASCTVLSCLVIFLSLRQYTYKETGK